MEINNGIENPKPLLPYSVSRDIDGATAICSLTRGVWNVVGTGRFFAYEFDVLVEGEAFQCVECNSWTIYPVNGGCPSCRDIIGWET